MSKEFVRTIKKTNLGGNKLSPNTDLKEPFFTNSQNDLLSDDTDVFVRNNDEYHCLTDGLKTVNTGNEVTTVENDNKNEITITTKETGITSTTDSLVVDKKGVNEFELTSQEIIVKSADDYIIIDRITDDNVKINYEVKIDFATLYDDIVTMLKDDGYITDEEGETDE